MGTEYGKRLRAARKHADMTQMELSKLTGIPQSTISTAERMGHGSAETPIYARACGVDAHWLATGDGDMLGFVTSIPKTGDAGAVQSNVLLVGLNKRVPRLAWREIQGFIRGMFTPTEDRYEVVSSRDVTARCFMVEIDGDAMVSASAGESIPAGAMLICDPDRTAKAGDVVIALHPKTGEPMARRIICDAGVWFLKASNPAYPLIEVSGLDCVVAKAIEVITRRTLL